MKREKKQTCYNILCRKFLIFNTLHEGDVKFPLVTASNLSLSLTQNKKNDDKFLIFFC